MKNLKALKEQRAAKHASLTALIDEADQEQRAMTAEETAEFDRLEQEIRDIDGTIERETRSRGIVEPVNTDPEQRTIEQQEERAFVDYIFGRVQEMRVGEQNLDLQNNGVIIPTTIANRIIKEVKDRCPILQRATVYHIKGTLMIPAWGATDEGDKITVAYAEDFEELEAHSGKFKAVELGGFLFGALTKIGRRLENNATFNVAEFIVKEIAEAVAVWMEDQLLNGSGSSAAQGLLNVDNVLAASGANVTFDDLVNLQAMVKKTYQKNACWVMNNATFTKVKLLKDENKRPLLQEDASKEFPYALLGKPVDISDAMPDVGSGNKPILYGDYSALSVNIRENLSVEILREKYATQHAIGVVAWGEFDARVTNHQAAAVLQMG